MLSCRNIMLLGFFSISIPLAYGDPLSEHISADTDSHSLGPQSAPQSNCDVLVVGVSLGGVMAAHQAALDGLINDKKICLLSNAERYGGQLTEQATPIDLQFGGRSLSYSALEYFTLRYYAQDPLPKYPPDPVPAPDPTLRPVPSFFGKMTPAGRSAWSTYQAAYFTQDWNNLGSYQPGKSRRSMSFEPKVAAYAISHNFLAEFPNLTHLRYYKLLDVNGTWTDCSHFNVEGVQVSDGMTSYAIPANITIDATELGEIYALVANKSKPNGPTLFCGGGKPNQDSLFYVGRDGATRFKNYLGDNRVELSELDSGGAALPDPECVQPITFPFAAERVRINDNDSVDSVDSAHTPPGYAGVVEQKALTKELKADLISPDRWNGNPSSTYTASLCSLPTVTPVPPVSCSSNDQCSAAPGYTGSSCTLNSADGHSYCEFDYLSLDGQKSILHSKICTQEVRHWQFASKEWSGNNWAYRRMVGRDDADMPYSARTFIPSDSVASQWLGFEYADGAGVPTDPVTRLPNYNYAHDISIINLHTNDLLPGNLREDGTPDQSKQDKICPNIGTPLSPVLSCNIIGKSPDIMNKIMDAGRNLSVSVYDWWRLGSGGDSRMKNNIRLRPDVFGWAYPYDQNPAHAVSAFPYIREARRLNAMHIITQNEAIAVSDINGRGLPVDPITKIRPPTTNFSDSVGLASYNFDTHGCTTHASAGEVKMRDDLVPARKMQIPLGALVPLHIDNLLAGNSKTMGVTHVSNMAYRTHLAEANVGQAAGAAAAVAVTNHVLVRDMANHWDPNQKRWVPGSQDTSLRQMQCHLLLAHKSVDKEGPIFLGGGPLSWLGSVPRFIHGQPNPAWVSEEMSLVGSSTVCSL